jgi:hypothetical protein
MKNSELLEAESSLLTGLEQQKQFILKLNAMPRPCPNCGMAQNAFEASRIKVDDWDFNKTDEQYHCINPSCHRELRFDIPFVSLELWHWGLVPVKP